MEIVKVGDEVSLTTSDGEYEGVVYRKSDCNLTLAKVKILSSGEAQTGNLKFFKNEIKSVKIVSEGKEINKSVTPIHDANGRKLAKVKELPRHLKMLDNDIDSNVLLNRKPHHPSGVQTTVPKIPLPEPVIVNEINDSYRKAVSALSGQDIVGLSANGVCIGRKGLLCWLNLSTKDTIYLFDILYLGHNGFTNGLKAILEDSNIIKIIHDCRFLSDALYHKYGVELKNVFDTQVTDQVVYMQREGTFNTYVRSLSQCLEAYLRLRPEDLFYPRIRQGYEHEDGAIWKERPIPEHLISGISKEVGYLIPLRSALIEQCLNVVTKGTHIYLTTVKNLRDEDAACQQGFTHLLPAQFKSLIPKRGVVNANTKPDEGRKVTRFDTVRVKGCDPYVYFSKDVWHKNTH